jgi:hypothetical protein
LTTRVSVVPLFLYSSIGYLASLVTPLQAGELLRPGLLRLGHRIPFLQGLVSIGIERLCDVFCLVVLGSVSLALLPESQTHERWLTESLRIAGILSSVGLVGLLVAAILARRYRNTFAIVLRPLPESLKTRLSHYADSMLEGADVLKSPFRVVMILLSSLLLWIVNYLSVLLIFHAVGVSAHPVTVLLGFALLSLGIALPLTPAGIGQYEAIWTLVYMTLGVRPEASVVAMGLLTHAVILLVIMLLGLIGVLALPRSMLRDAFDNRIAAEALANQQATADGPAMAETDNATRPI